MPLRKFGSVDRFHRNPTDTWFAASLAAAFADLLLLLLSSCFPCFADAFGALLLFLQSFQFCCSPPLQNPEARLCVRVPGHFSLRLFEIAGVLPQPNPPDRPAPDPPAPERPSPDHQEFRAFSFLVLKISLFVLLFQFLSLRESSR